MPARTTIGAAVFLFVMFFAYVAPAAAQSKSCTANQDAAVQCFVANAVTTDLSKPRYGMSLAQFEAYGVAVSHILQSHHTYLMLVGTSSAIADAMPPTNANGTANQSAQDMAVTQITSAAVTDGLANTSDYANLQDLEWFSLDVTGAMNDNNDIMGMLTPGVSLRIIDSYIITETTNGTVNWTAVDSSLSTAVDNFISSGMLKVPAPMTAAELKSFVESVAHVIYNYKVATGRKTL
ncbi:MAG TPA: hypothetical protein VGD60_02715 [Candidatus Acidoferrales bacterium]